jgi:hemoglobin
MNMNTVTVLSRSLFAAGFFILANSASAQTLYDALGGKTVMDAVIRSSITRWQANPVLKEAFKNANTERLAEQLGDQFCALAGGGCKYEGEDMKSSHAKMNVTTAQFNALAEDLQRVMIERGIPFTAQNQLIALLAPMKRDIVTR